MLPCLKSGLVFLKNNIWLDAIIIYLFIVGIIAEVWQRKQKMKDEKLYFFNIKDRYKAYMHIGKKQSHRNKYFQNYTEWEADILQYKSFCMQDKNGIKNFCHYLIAWKRENQRLKEGIYSAMIPVLIFLYSSFGLSNDVKKWSAAQLTIIVISVSVIILGVAAGKAYSCDTWINFCDDVLKIVEQDDTE